jgi:hypothetical protein
MFSLIVDKGMAAGVLPLRGRIFCSRVNFLRRWFYNKHR